LPPSKCSSATASEHLRSYLTAIWQHSVHTAALAHMLARVRTRLNPDEAFLAGLLHEVGRLYILMHAKENAEVLASEEAFESVLAEWHPRLGRAVIETWALPAELAEAVGEHQACGLEAPEPPAVDACARCGRITSPSTARWPSTMSSFTRSAELGSLSMDKPTFDWLIRAGDVDIRLLMLAFGV